MYIDGSDVAGTPMIGDANHQDILITDCVLDVCKVEPLTIRNINGGGMIEIRNTYAATTSNVAGSKGIVVDNSMGMVSICGGQIVNNVNVNNNGMLINNSKQIRVVGTQFKNFYQGVVGSNSHIVHLEPMITRTRVGGGSAIVLLGCTRSHVFPQVGGSAQVWSNGISLDVGSANNETNITQIDIGVLASSSAGDKLRYNGSPVTAANYGIGNVRSGVAT
ncbi:hypothetical protein G4G27_23795 [Sphingomonas sp. So64.6b]|nr:hypothetical protein G4G27_23795 [Sphingomonas sp. So64.6b]